MADEAPHGTPCTPGTTWRGSITAKPTAWTAPAPMARRSTSPDAPGRDGPSPPHHRGLSGPLCSRERMARGYPPGAERKAGQGRVHLGHDGADIGGLVRVLAAGQKDRLTSRVAALLSGGCRVEVPAAPARNTQSTGLSYDCGRSPGGKNSWRYWYSAEHSVHGILFCLETSFEQQKKPQPARVRGKTPSLRRHPPKRRSTD